MFWTLVTVLFAGFAGAGIGLVLRHLSRGRLPNGIIPVCAGLTMILATIGQEYGWSDGVRSTMAADLVVISTREQQSWYQPWTFIQPWVRGFIAFSPAETVETAQGSGLYAVQLRLQERWQPQMVRPALFDCAGARWTDLNATMVFDAAGQPIDALWREEATEDVIFATVCAIHGDGG